MSRAGAAAIGAALFALVATETRAAEAPPGASSCSGCHAVRASTTVPPIHGRPADEIADALAAFRAGTRPATVMNRIATGFTPAESRAIAAWLSEQAAPR